MKATLVITFLLVSLAASAQSRGLLPAVAALEQALVAKDTAALSRLLHPALSYGHSNGWVQTRAEVKADLLSGKLQYDTIRSGGTKWWSDGALATVQSQAHIAYRLNGSPGKLELHVLQVWRRTKDGWQLLARQSTKIN